MDLAWTKREGVGAQEALRHLLENIGFKEVEVRWPSKDDYTMWGDAVPEVIDFLAIFTTTKEQRHSLIKRTKPLWREDLPPLHVQIIEGLAGMQASKWVKFGAGQEWCYGFRIVEVERQRKNFDAGVVEARIQAKKMPHKEPKAPPHRTPRWL